MVSSLTSLSSEILLRILSSLDDARDLARSRQVNRRLHAVGGDALLWRDLFIDTYLCRSSLDTLDRHPHRKRQRLAKTGTNVEVDSNNLVSIPARVIRSLPMMHELTSSMSGRDQENSQKVDWYTLFKVSRNWQTGNFSSRHLQTTQNQDRTPQDAVAGPSRSSAIAERRETNHVHPGTLIESTQSHIFAAFRASDHNETCPTVVVFPSVCRKDVSKESSQETLARYQSPSMASRKHRNLFISSLAVDRGVVCGSRVRLFVGYSSGDSSLLYFDCASNTFHDETFLFKTDTDSIVAAALHCQMLMTCTKDFKIRIFNLKREDYKLIEERRTYSCHWPASFRLEPLDNEDVDSQFRLSIAYSSPVYPTGWTVGLQEIIVGSRSALSSRSVSARRAHVITCIDSPAKQDNSNKYSASGKATAQDRNQVGRLTSLSYEDPFIVVGTKDNDVICYRVTGSASVTGKTRNSTYPTLELSHACTFQGHTGTVHSVSLSEGRCVTGGSDGSVRIWRLGDEETAVAKAAGLLTTIDASLRRGLGKVVTIGASSFNSKRKRDDTEAVTSTAPLSLADILREVQSSSTNAKSSRSSAVVRLVTSAFDRIISVSAVKTFSGQSHVPNSALNCRSEANLEREEEQVQIWNFSN